MFKKKSLKFTYEKVSRDLRHAESLKARETSRFKRLSIMRSINDSDYLDKSMETERSKEDKVKKETQATTQKETFQKPSRLEMLFKWKQEKQMKKEMEKLAKKKPFYTGGNKSILEKEALQSFKSSASGQSSSSFNSSKFAKSKLATPISTQSSQVKQFTPGTSQSSKIPHSKQGTPGSTIQSSNGKQNASISTFQWSKNAISKQTTLAKSGNNLSRSNSTTTLQRKFPASAADKTTFTKSGTSLNGGKGTATLSRKFPASAADKTCTLAKTAVNRNNDTAAVPRKFPVPSIKIDKVVSSKVQTGPFLKRTPHVPINGNATKSVDPAKPFNKGLLESRTLPKRQEEKSVKKTGISMPKILPKLKSNAAVIKGIPVQDKIPISNMTKKFGSNPKLNQKEASQSKENIPSRKGYCFRTAIENSRRQKADILSKTPMQDSPKKLPEKISNEHEKPAAEQLNELSLDCIPDVTFNSDLSIIKPARTSFAPANFIFQPPAGLDIFDDDYDVYQDLEEVKLNFMSRTSTPTKNSERKSSIKSSKESLESDNQIADVEKTSNLSNSNDIRISELMTPSLFEVKIDNKEVEKLVNEQTCNEVACDMITNIEIKKVNTEINQQTSVKEADIAVNQESCEELASVSPIKTKLKFNNTINQQTSPEISSDIHTDLKLEAQEESASISPVKAVVTTNSTETVVKNIDSAEQKCLFNEKQSLDDSDIIENPKGNKVEKSNTEKHFNQSVQNGTYKRIDEDSLFFLDDESLLDSIDLNKIMIKSDDEDSDEDDVPSLQIPKCSERKSNGAFPKRVSMLKRLSVMNSIAETNETECGMAKSPNSQDTKSTPRRSKRLSNLIPVDTLSYSPLENADNDSTPRRSLRLMKMSSASDNHPVSPFQEKNMNVSSRRRSVRLIDLNTPEKAACQKLIGENFENLDPNKVLVDLESPTMPVLQKSRKVSLLYSPERRKSIRKSIKGDLISFSPV